MVSVGRFCALALISFFPASAQVIEFEQNGLKYQTLTRAGVTVMFAHMPQHLRGYSMLQVAISNGSPLPCAVRTDDFAYVRPAGPPVPATPPRQIVSMLMARGDHADVVKLTLAYESALYGINSMKVTNGYEQRRQNAMSEGVSAKFKAAAAASAIVLVATRLKPGESTDGALFFANEAKALTGGHLSFRVGGEVFTFNDD